LVVGFCALGGAGVGTIGGCGSIGTLGGCTGVCTLGGCTGVCTLGGWNDAGTLGGSAAVGQVDRGVGCPVAGLVVSVEGVPLDRAVGEFAPMHCFREGGGRWKEFDSVDVSFSAGCQHVAFDTPVVFH
jgi:hypothetical protein